MTEAEISHKRAHPLPVARFLGTLRIRNTTTTEAGVQKWGFSELLHRLNAPPEEETLRVEEFNLADFAARRVFKGDSTTLLGCTIVKRKQKIMQTPPAWDGSLDALERINLPEG